MQMIKSPYYPLGVTKNNKKIISPRCIRFVQRNPRLQRYHFMFINIAKNARKYCQNIKSDRDIDILKLLRDIIPIEYFGTKKNRKRFENMVNLILTHSMYECTYTSNLKKYYIFEDIPWLKFIYKRNCNISYRWCRQYVAEANIWLLEKIVKPIIARFYFLVKTGQTYELQFVPRSIWVEFRKKAINTLKSKGYLIPLAADHAQPRAVLHIRPKSGCDNPNNFRPIMRLLPERKNVVKEQREVIKYIYAAARRISPIKTNNIFKYWKEYVTKTMGEKIYAVKVDVEDAFGNVNIDVLCCILRAQFNHKRIPERARDWLLGHVQNQYIIYGKTKDGKPLVARWRHGLLQGDRASAALCYLYMNHLEKDGLDKEYFNDPKSFLHRTVDDYFFCSTDQLKVERFITEIKSIYSLNENKTQSNLPDYNHDKINYCGRLFLINTKQVRGFYDFKKGTELRYKFKLWNMNRIIHTIRDEGKTSEDFIKRAVLFSSINFYFSNILLSTVINKEETVIRNFFESMLLLGFKFDAAFMAVYEKIPDFSSIITLVKRIVHKYTHKAQKRIIKLKGRCDLSLLSFDMLLKTGFQAFLLVFKKRTHYKTHGILDEIEIYTKRIRISKDSLTIFKECARKMPDAFQSLSIKRKFIKKTYSK